MVESHVIELHCESTEICLEYSQRLDAKWIASFSSGVSLYILF